MNDCEAMREAMQACLDGALAPAERQRLDAHLASCGACRRRLAQYRRLFAALDEPVLPEPSPTLAATVMRRIALGRRRAQRWQNRVAVAAMLLIGSGAALLAWGTVPAAEWLTLSDLDPVAIGQALLEGLRALAQSAAAWPGEWLPAVPGGPLLPALAAILLGANAALAYRWRGLARPNGEHPVRTMR